jgi:TPR repeat protein
MNLKQKLIRLFGMSNETKPKSTGLLRILLICFSVIILGVIIFIAMTYFLAYKDVPQAEQLIGGMYKEGFLIYPQDNNQAKKWFQRAAEKNYAEGQCSLGGIYEIEKEYRKAAYWYVKAAIQNLPRCQYNFGRLYARGLGIEKNEAAAFIWTKKAADNKNSYAEFSVAVDLINGKIVPKDITKGLYYLKQSAEQANSHAQGYLALIYLRGELLPRDLIESRKWAKMAGENGDPQAEFLLSETAKLEQLENKGK